MRYPTIHRFLKWAGPSLIAASACFVGLVIAASGEWTGVKGWAEQWYYAVERIVILPWFLFLAAILIVGYFWALIYTGGEKNWGAGFILTQDEEPSELENMQNSKTAAERTVPRQDWKGDDIGFDDEFDYQASRMEGAPPKRDKSFDEAAAYLYIGQWGGNLADAAGDDKFIEQEPIGKLIQAALDDELRIWGKQSSNSNVYQRIPSEYWKDHQPNFIEFLRGSSKTETTEIGASNQTYYDLMVSRAEVELMLPFKQPKRPKEMGQAILDQYEGEAETFPYRKAVLQVKDLKATASKLAGADELSKISCHIDIENHAGTPLKDCEVQLVSINGQLLEKASFLRIGGLSNGNAETVFTTYNHSVKRINFMKRDLQDVVSNSPMLLCLHDRDFPLSDGKEYRFIFALRSEYEYPTYITVRCLIPQRDEIEISVENQSLDMPDK